MTKAFLISPEAKSIEPVELTDMNDIKSLVGFDTIASDPVGEAGDQLFFDEECFIRGASGRFKVDSLVPVAGKGLVVGVAADGVTLTDASTTLDQLRSRIAFS
jgi:hypothetical protein